MHDHLSRVAAASLIALAILAYVDPNGTFPLGGNDLAEGGILFGAAFVISEIMGVIKAAIKSLRVRVRRARRNRSKRAA